MYNTSTYNVILLAVICSILLATTHDFLKVTLIVLFSLYLIYQVKDDFYKTLLTATVPILLHFSTSSALWALPVLSLTLYARKAPVKLAVLGLVSFILFLCLMDETVAFMRGEFSLNKSVVNSSLIGLVLLTNMLNLRGHVSMKVLAISAALLLSSTITSTLATTSLPFLLASLVPISVFLHDAFTRPRYHSLTPPTGWIGAWIGGKYRVVGIIGRGGFSYVLEGVDDEGSRYAIKVLRFRDELGNPLAQNPEVLKVFRQEMSKHLVIDHPHIVKVYEVHVPSDEKLPYRTVEEYMRDPPYMVMEHMEGGSLRHYLAKHGPMPLEQFIEMAIQVVRGLEAIHSMGLVHLDIKPENILFSRDLDKVKIGDLGAAKVMTAFGVYVSQFSPAYSAPETFRGIATWKSDLYSLTCVMYEALTGANPQSYILRGLKPPPISTYNRGIPRELEVVIMKCLDPDPKKRPELKELIEVLEKLRANL